LPSNFDHLLFWWCSGDKMIDDIIFHKLSSILETRVCSTEMVQEPSMIFTSGLNYTTVVACKFIEVGATSLESNKCWSTNLSGRWMSILAKTFEQLMLWQDLTRQNDWGFSIESHLLIQLSSLLWNPW
jgi:hypothetical protein